MATFCVCGAQAGYPHAADCPEHYYGNDPARLKQWSQDHANLQTFLTVAGEQCPRCQGYDLFKVAGSERACRHCGNRFDAKEKTL